ncbi:MAG: ABC transporter substrate-binding protein [Actinobacteria bacterium]|nr:ABC transporter substrate-binding protein [Actinomycetota bacterium]MCI0679126.1 ABC transporter substrate-binding protein [Actinomycetota bacterium]
MRNKSPSWRLLAILATFALIAAGCSPDGATDTTAGPGTTEAPVTTAGPGTTDGPGTTVSSEPIKVGVLTDLTGFTPWAVQVQDGMLLAAEEINAAGGVNGRMIEIVVEDSANDADAGATGYERLVEAGVVAIGGIISSTVGATVSPLAEEAQIPTFMIKSGTQAALTQDSRYMFRTCLPAAPMAAAPVLKYAQDAGFTTVGVIVADYPWGQAFMAAFEAAFAGSGIDYGEIQVAPVPPDTDFTPFVRNIDPDAQLLVATGHPPGNTAIVTLSADLLGDVPVTGAWAPPNLAVGNLADLAIGRFVDFSCADYTGASYAALAERYLAFSENQFMSDDAVAGFGIVTMVATAAGEVGDDPVAIADYIRAGTFELEGYAHPLSWTEWGELASSAPMVNQISEGPAPEGLNEAGDWWIEVLSQSDTLDPYVPGS